MISVSAEFKAKVRQTHQVRFAAHVYDGTGKLVVDLTGGLVGGSVTIDATATVRRRCSISVDRTFIPTAGGGGSYGPARNRYGDMRSRYGDGGERTYGDLAQAPSELSPLGGHELIVWRGVMLDGGRVEWVQLGVFGISSVRASASSTAPLVEITGYDRSRLVSMAKWLEPYQVKDSKQSHEVVAAIVKTRIPAIKHSTVSVGSSRVATAAVLGTSTSNDPWQDCQDIAAAADLETYFDHEGSLVIRLEPSSTGAAVWTFNAGDDGVLIEREYEESDEGIYNQVVVTSDSGAGGFSVRATASDSDPSSPTYINGPFGRRPLLLSTDEAATEAECMTLAQNKLREVLGTDQELTITAIPMPALVPGDRVRVVDGVGVDATFQVSALTIPLDFATPMIVQVKRPVS